MTPERADAFSGLALLFGCVAVLLSALAWAAVWPPALAVATGLGGVGVILLCAAVKWARVAGYEERRREEQDR